MDKKKYPIPIKNLFYMLCYAWNVLAIKDDIKVSEDDYDDAYDLLARVFSFGIGRLIRSGFHRSYVERIEEVSTIRGKINIQKSINELTMLNKKMVCSFDEYTTDDIFNRILKYTINSILRNPGISNDTKKMLKKQALYFSEIGETAPTRNNRKKITFNRNNVIYKLLIDISVMIYEGTVVNEEEGLNTFKDFYREEQMHKVFELFILNFYSAHLNKAFYKVHAPKINWKIEEDAKDVWGDLFDVDNDPGDRRTDIVIENKKKKLQLIFDAKYYKKTLVDSYMGNKEENIRTNHLNQLRGYLLDSDYDGKKIGALL